MCCPWLVQMRMSRGKWGKIYLMIACLDPCYVLCLWLCEDFNIHHETQASFGMCGIPSIKQIGLFSINCICIVWSSILLNFILSMFYHYRNPEITIANHTVDSISRREGWGGWGHISSRGHYLLCCKSNGG